MHDRAVKCTLRTLEQQHMLLLADENGPSKSGPIARSVGNGGEGTCDLCTSDQVIVEL